MPAQRLTMRRVRELLRLHYGVGASARAMPEEGERWPHLYQDQRPSDWRWWKHRLGQPTISRDHSATLARFLELTRENICEMRRFKTNRYSENESGHRPKRDFFIDRFRHFMNKSSFDTSHRGKKQWTSVTMAK
jgi:hypothetical protein